jgi:phage/plasmid-associated DNA primase
VLGGDPFEVNPKNKNAISIVFTAPAIWATNHEPKFKESTKAMINRMLLMRLSNVFDTDNKIGAAAEAHRRKYREPQDFVLSEEKSGILNWALIGAQSAINRGNYIDTEEGKAALHEVRIDSNFVAGFVEECIDFNPNVRMSVPDFNASFMSWWKEHRGDEKTVSPDHIGRALKALSHAKIAIDRHKFKNEKGMRYICGIELNEAGRDHWQHTIDSISTPGFGSSGDLARVSDLITSVHTKIPPGKNWWEHPLIVKLRANAAKEKVKPKF